MHKTTMHHLTKLVAAMAIAPFLSWAGAASANDYPTKPIRMIVPYAAGGASDQLARILQPKLGELLGQQIIIDNKPGAAGAVGVELAVRAEPDGYTLVMGNSGPNSIVPVIKKTPYDPIKDLKPISFVASMPLILAVNKNVPADNVKQFIAWAKANPKDVTYGTTGVGGFSHLTTEYFKKVTGIPATHIPYKGGGPAALALRTGEVKLYFSTPIDGEAQFRAGEIKYLGVTSAKPTDLIPGVPPVAETVPGFISIAWFGLLAPKGTPDAIVEKVRAAVVTAMKDPALQKSYSVLRVIPTSNTPAEFQKIIETELANWSNVVKDLNIVFE